MALAPQTDDETPKKKRRGASVMAWILMAMLIGGLGGLFALSDERAKEDKKKIGKTKDGLGIYSYRYKGDPETRIGLMAQEVAKKKPGAVATRRDGLMAVDYREALS